MNYLVTGGCGFVGSNIASYLLGMGSRVTVFDNLSRFGAASNLAWLKELGCPDFVHGDIRHPHEVELLIKSRRPDVVFHLAGQVAMTTSMNDPRKDFQINVVGSLNLLESVREHAPEAVIVYSSSNKVYGLLDGVALSEEPLRYVAPAHPNGVDENMPLDFHTPYGCSKGAADQYMLDYARCFNLRTVVFRHSTIFGGRQFATLDQGWVGWFCQQALEVLRNPGRQPFTISGDGKQVRDLLFVEDAVRCYLAAVDNINQVAGQAFNIGGGINNSSSLLELFEFLQRELSVELAYTRLPWRQSDQKLFVADIAKARKLLNWEPKISKEDGIRRMLHWIQSGAVT